MQSLADNDPDVDGMYRLSSKLPVTFLHKAAQRAIPPFVFTPFNAQAVLFDRSALWGLLLPVTVHGRVTDIWRSYFTTRLLWDIGKQVGFVSPWVTQYRNPHSYQGDFNSEVPLYTQAEALVNSHTEHKQALTYTHHHPEREFIHTQHTLRSAD
jgi:hypothetical protein